MCPRVGKPNSTLIGAAPGRWRVPPPQQRQILPVGMDLCKARSHRRAFTTSSMEGDVPEVGTCLPVLSLPSISLYQYANTSSREPCRCNPANFINGLRRG